MNQAKKSNKNVIKNTTKNFIRKSLLPAAISLGLAQAFMSAALALPSGGQVAAGNVSIAKAGNQMNVNQASNQAIVNWQSFNVGAQETVNFNQPSSTSVILNRVVGSNPSAIYGRMNANGRVMLVNTNGIAFGPNAQVDVGGLVASTLPISDSDFLANNWQFNRTSGSANILNQGALNAADHGFVALLGGQVSNKGVITAKLGTVGLIAANKVTLTFNDDKMLSITVDKGTYNALVDNQQIIQADGGYVLLSAQAADTLSKAVINHSGIIEAKTVEDKAGKVYLLADMKNGQVNLNGTIDASAPTSGDGGFVETSAAHVKIGDKTRVKTLSANGKNGKWLIDPFDFYISLTGGDITGATLSANLNLGDVTIYSENGATPGVGNIYVNAPISWTEDTILSLRAMNQIFINADIKLMGEYAGLEILPMVSFWNPEGIDWSEAPYYYHISNGAKITLPGRYSTLKIGSGEPEYAYYRLIRSIEELQAINNGNDTYWSVSYDSECDCYAPYLAETNYDSDMGYNYALAVDIDASDTINWNNGRGFRPIGGYGKDEESFGAPAFTGIFDGLGHSIKNLYINRTDSSGAQYWNIGLFGEVGNSGYDDESETRYIDGAIIRNIGLINANITGSYDVGGLIGYAQYSWIENNYVFNSSVRGDGSGIGGLIGYADNSIINNNYVQTNAQGVSGNSDTGGLIGYAYNSHITHNYVSGKVSTINNDYDNCDADCEPTINALNSENFSDLTDIAGLVGYFYADGCEEGCEFTNPLLAYNYVNAQLPYFSEENFGAGALIGYNSEIQALNPADLATNYWDVQQSGTPFSLVGQYVWNGDGVDVTDIPVGTPVPTTAQMQQQSTFSGWDFGSNWNNTWFMYEGHTAPMLRSFMKPLLVSVGPAGATYETPYNLDPIDYSRIFGALKINPTPSGLWSNQQGYVIFYDADQLANEVVASRANATGGCSPDWIDPELAEALQNMPLLAETLNSPGYQVQYNLGNVRLLTNGAYQGSSKTVFRSVTGCANYYVAGAN